MFCHIFTAAKTFSDVVMCEIEHFNNTFYIRSIAAEVSSSKAFVANVLFYM